MCMRFGLAAAEPEIWRMVLLANQTMSGTDEWLEWEDMLVVSLAPVGLLGGGWSGTE